MRNRLLLALGLVGAAALAVHATAWKRFVAADRGFSVEMPGDPTHKEGALEGGLGAATNHTYGLVADGCWYHVMVAEFRSLSGDAKTLLDVFRDANVKGSRATLISEESISLDGNPGRQLKTQGPPGAGILTARIYLLQPKKRLFQVGVATPPSKVSSDTVSRFLDSFRLTK